MTVYHDIQRHKRFFKPESLSDKKIAIVGCGAIGSHLAVELASLGLANQLALYDFDIVEPHNTPNQYFGAEDVGLNKATQLEAAIQRKVGIFYDKLKVFESKIPPYDDNCENQAMDEGIQYLRTSNIIFSCVDSMSARMTLFKDYFLDNANSELFFETRIGSNSYQLNKILRTHKSAIDTWQNAWYSDDEVDMSEADPCGSMPTVGSIVLSAVAATSLWFKHIYDTEKAYVDEDFGVKGTLSDPNVYTADYYGSSLRTVLTGS